MDGYVLKLYLLIFPTKSTLSLLKTIWRTTHPCKENGLTLDRSGGGGLSYQNKSNLCY